MVGEADAVEGPRISVVILISMPLLWPGCYLLLAQGLFRPEILGSLCPLEATSANDWWKSADNSPAPPGEHSDGCSISFSALSQPHSPLPH